MLGLVAAVTLGFAAATPAPVAAPAPAPPPSRAQIAAVAADIKGACAKSGPPGAVAAHVKFCGCFAGKTAPTIAALPPQERAVFVIMTEYAGMVGKAQKAAESRLKVSVGDFVTMWDRLNPIGADAGKACAKA